MKQVRSEQHKAKLDQFSVDIEFLLISVIQGVALGTLASNAAAPIGDLQFEYWLYITSGFLFILNFWSQAIIHTVSFIDWPLDLTHNFLYFLVSFIEVGAFNHVTNPLRWFAFISAFFVASMVLYVFDVFLIKKHEDKFRNTKAKKHLYHHILGREQLELSIFLPLALLYSLVSTVLIFLYPQVFIAKHYHIFLIALQAFFGAVFLIDSAKNFRKRAELISTSFNH